MRKLILTAAACLLAPAAANAAVFNGDFEASLGDPTGYTGGTEIQALAGGAYQACCNIVGTPAQLANQFATFGAGNQANVSTLSQIVSTLSGQQYAFSYDFGALGSGSQTLTAKIFDNATNALLGMFLTTATATGNLGNTFTTSTSFFTAGSNATRIEFSVDAVTNNVDGALDNVAINAVPEAATWAMMIAGFGLVGAGMRRRAARASLATA